MGTCRQSDLHADGHEFSPAIAVCSSAAPDFPGLFKTIHDTGRGNATTSLKRLYIAGKIIIRLLLSSSHKMQRTDEKPSAPYPRPMRKYWRMIQSRKHEQSTVTGFRM